MTFNNQQINRLQKQSVEECHNKQAQDRSEQHLRLTNMLQDMRLSNDDCDTAKTRKAE